jgi:ribonuclease-3
MIKLPIKNQQLKKEALTHRSYLNEHSDTKVHNERLEFLGDAVLELIVTRFLFDNFPHQPEGWLTALRAALVKTTTLSQVAQKLDLGTQLRLSRGEEQGGGRQNLTLLANTFEAVVGAIYLDSGLSTAQEFISTHLLTPAQIDRILTHKLFKDFKSLLQETVQAQGQPTPTYKLLGQSGPDHNKLFTVAVLVADKTLGQGTGKSKQEAQNRQKESTSIPLCCPRSQIQTYR